MGVPATAQARAVGGLVGYDDGGNIDPSGGGGIGGMTPSAMTANPLIQGATQRYATLPTEKLQELAGAMGGSSQGQIIRGILQKRQTQPNAQQALAGQPPPQQTITPAGMMQPQQPQAQRRGGVTRRDIGGGVSLSEADPSWTRQQSRGEVSGGNSGVLAGGTFGRADSIQTTAPGGAYVLPADVISALGEGNTLAGARIVDEMLSSGPHGTPMPRGGRGMGAPRPPPGMPTGASKGGVLAPRGPAPVALSDGEYVIHPSDVLKIGHGNLKMGHKILDAFVEHVRSEHIKKLENLPGPVKP